LFNKTSKFNVHFNETTSASEDLFVRTEAVVADPTGRVRPPTMY